MVTGSADLILVTFISASLLLVRCEVQVVSKQLKSTIHSANSDAWTCHDGFMSVYMSKKKYDDLPYNIYIQDEHSGYYQAVAVAKHCHYVLGETKTFIILTVASHGCYVKKQEYTTNLTVAIMTHADKGRLEIVKKIPVICERKMKDINKNEYSLVSGNLFCNKDGFEITIPQNATVPPLNLDAVWISSNQSANCKPRRSNETVTFRFPFTECGTQSMIEDGIITYWVYVEVKQHPQRGSIFRSTPFNLTVHCSFTLAQVAQLGFNVQEENTEDVSILKSEGILRTEMRFAKDSNYRSFYSSRDPLVTELGMPVYVEVSVLKNKQEDLGLVLEDCWATPTKNPLDPQRWNLLVKRCPFTGDSHTTAVLPVVSSKEIKYPSLHKWFAVKLFSFVKPQTNKNQVYFHCDVEICKGPDCSQSCSIEREISRRAAPRPGERSLYTVVSGGPLLYLK